MFVQVIRGHVKDADSLHRQLDRWTQELSSGAKGWLGTTAGISPNGEFVGIARFESEDAARANSSRPEQGAWWSETEKCFDGPVTFQDCPDVEVVSGGGSDEAGFVQVITGMAKDVGRVKQVVKSFESYIGEARPDIIGNYVAMQPDGGFTEVAYFTSEAEARANEQKPMPAEVKNLYDQWTGLLDGMQFIDVKQPWLYSPRS